MTEVKYMELKLTHCVQCQQFIIIVRMAQRTWSQSHWHTSWHTACHTAWHTAWHTAPQVWSTPHRTLACTYSITHSTQFKPCFQMPVQVNTIIILAKANETAEKTLVQSYRQRRLSGMTIDVRSHAAKFFKQPHELVHIWFTHPWIQKSFFQCWNTHTKWTEKRKKTRFS